MPSDNEELNLRIAALRDRLDAVPRLLQSFRMFDQIDKDLQNLQAATAEAKLASLDQLGYVSKQHLEISQRCGVTYYNDRWFTPPKDEVSARRSALDDLFYIEDGIAAFAKAILTERLPPSDPTEHYRLVSELEVFRRELRYYARKAIGGSLNELCLSIGNIRVASWILNDYINRADSVSQDRIDKGDEFGDDND